MWLLKVRPIVRAFLVTVLPWLVAGALALWFGIHFGTGYGQ